MPPLHKPSLTAKEPHQEGGTLGLHELKAQSETRLEASGHIASPVGTVDADALVLLPHLFPPALRGFHTLGCFLTLS